MKILLIEPDRQLGEIYGQALTGAGHTVRWEREAQAAIMAADDLQPEVVILEVQLARHNGIEFLYEFRSYPDWQQVPVILYTYASSLPADDRLLNQLGVQAVHSKLQTSLADLLASLEALFVSA